MRVWISGSNLLLREHAVEPLDFVDDLALGALANALGVADVVHGVAFGLEQDSLEFAGQEAGRPLAGGDRLEPGSCRRDRAL